MSPSAIATSLDAARERDAADELARYREAFDLPRGETGEALCYLSGHSLGLMPRAARTLTLRELDRWSSLGVEGHFEGDDGWYRFHERFARPLADLLGAEADEVVAMNSLTVNLHLMLASFFRPDGERRRILIERHAFPSDRFAVQSQLAWHGLDPVADLVEIGPDDGRPSAEGRLSADGLDEALEAENGRVALVLLPGVQYFSGEAVDLAACASVARRHGCLLGFDLAHAIGNLAVDLRLSEPDFAVWCNYKYLNGGPGTVGGCFVNRRWHGDDRLPRLAGWWGHDPASRFDAGQPFTPMPTAEGWQLSNPPILAMAPLEASLALFSEASIGRLRQKSIALTGYLETLLLALCGERIGVVTPAATDARGAQLSIRLGAEAPDAGRVVSRLRAAGIVADWRKPDILRLAPAPLYNRYADVHAGASALAAALRG